MTLLRRTILEELFPKPIGVVAPVDRDNVVEDAEGETGHVIEGDEEQQDQKGNSPTESSRIEEEEEVNDDPGETKICTICLERLGKAAACCVVE
jgi:hypothetical protein